jgi:hypothetical protein
MRALVRAKHTHTLIRARTKYTHSRWLHTRPHLPGLVSWLVAARTNSELLASRTAVVALLHRYPRVQVHVVGLHDSVTRVRGSRTTLRLLRPSKLVASTLLPIVSPAIAQGS